MAKTERNKVRKSRGSHRKSKNTKKTETSTSSSGIDKSQRLLRSTQETRARRRSSNKKEEKRSVLDYICPKPMPSLSELEKMYDDDEEITDQNSVAVSIESYTPEQSSSAVPKGSLTPTSAKKYADELLKILDDLDTSKSPPIIPIKKYKKAEVQYIVGCTEHPQIPENPNCNVFKSDDYGQNRKKNYFNVEKNEDELKTPGFYCVSPYILSKSISNAQANEIASKLLSTENNSVIYDTDSDDTIVYEVNSPKSRFSPEPSTSRDHETILKNDQKFRESLIPLKKNNVDIDMNNMNIEPTHEVDVVTEDEILNTGVKMVDASNNNKEINSNFKICSPAKEIIHELVTDTEVPILDGSFDEDVEIIEQPPETITINEDKIFNIDVENKTSLHNKKESRSNNNIDLIEISDDDYEIKDVKVPVITTKCSNTIKRKTHKNINVEDNKPSKPDVIAEIDLTDIENVILQNQSLIDKYSKTRTVNIVKSSSSEPIMVRKTIKTELRNNINQSNSLQITKNDQNISKVNNDSNEFAQIVKNFFGKWGYTSLPHYEVNVPTLSRKNKIFPQLSLNKSTDRRDVLSIPYIQDNAPITSTNKRFSQIPLDNCVGTRGSTSISHSQTNSLNDSILHHGLSLLGPLSMLFQGMESGRHNNLPLTQSQRLITSSINKRSRRGNSDIPHTQAEITIMSRNEKNSPQVSKNNRVINNISNDQGNRPHASFSQDRIPLEPPPNNNVDNPTQSKTKKRKKKSKNDNNQSTNNLSNTNDAAAPSQSLGLGICPICLHKLSKEKIASTTCGHLFCLSCISTSLKFDKKCPACRKKLTARGYHPIFL